MKSPIIVHITDAHIDDPRREPNAHLRLRRIAETIAEQEDRDRTVICDTGDLGWSMASTEADKIRWALAPVYGWRMIFSQGNHDHGPWGLVRWGRRSDHWRDLVAGLTGHDPPEAPEIEVRSFAGVDFIAANSAHDQSFLARGKLGEEQIENIAQACGRARRAKKKSVLLIHHCPSGGNATKRLSDRRELGEALDSVGGVDLMLTGHLHRDREWSGVFGAGRLISTGPATETPIWYRRVFWNDLNQIRWNWRYAGDGGARSRDRSRRSDR